MLRTKVKPRQAVDPRNGKLVVAPFPTTREDALAENCARYYPFESCPTHYNTPEGQSISVYVSTGIRGCCAQINAAADYAAAVQNGEPLDPGQAHAAGLDYYWGGPQEQRACGHSDKRTLNGRCYVCAKSTRELSPRQEAIAAGSDWYDPLPGDECKEGHLAPRRVNNGSCRQCEQDQRAASKSLPMHRDPQFADMVIDRESARGLGLKIYRTGAPCVAGHLGWRYVSTGGCLTCMGR